MDPIQLPDSLANVAKHPCHRAGLHLALSSTLNPAPVIPGSHNHRGNVSNLKITQYEFRSSLKILSSFLDWTQIPILYFKCIILIIYSIIVLYARLRKLLYE
jgi:hypothetical protein